MAEMMMAARRQVGLPVRGYLLSRADEFPGLLDEDPEKWAELCEEVVSREVMRKLSIPEPVSSAIVGLRDAWMSMPPSSLLDTLLLANQFAPVASPLSVRDEPLPDHEDSVLDFVIDNATLQEILAESADEVKSMSAALLV